MVDMKLLAVVTPSSIYQYLHTILHVEELHQFDTLCAQVGSKTTKPFKTNHFLILVRTFDL